MQRIVRGISATLTHTFYVDGVATDPSPDTATVTITRDDGTAIVTDAGTTNAGVGVVSYTLTPAQTATLDTFTVTWKATIGGQLQSFTDVVEVAGGVLFTINQARALSALASTTTYPTAKIIEARTMVETALEDACEVAFVPRYGKVTVSGYGLSTIRLPARVRSIRSVKLDGVAVSSTDLATIRTLPTGEVYFPSYWTRGFANYVIAFEHGHDYPPPRVSQAALTWAKAFLVKGPIDDRTTSMSTDDGTFSLATPGLRGSFTGIPEVDAVINQYSLSVAVA